MTRIAGAAALLALPAASQEPTPRPPLPVCRVISWSDGDSGTLACTPGGALRFRIADHDAPELSGDCLPERAAAAFTHEAANQALPSTYTVVWRERYRDRFGRSVGDGWRVLDGASFVDAIAAAGGVFGWWPHDRDGRAILPRPTWCREE